jgi:alpha-beta hydrolase superfamily lysophospholipase
MIDKLIEHVESKFKASQDVELYQQWWTPRSDIQGVVVICHGIAEHSGRYDHVARFLCGRGYQVGSFDLRNHGRSGDHSIFVNAFDDYVADLDVFVTRARQTASGKPLFLLGHSMGGTIVILYTITRKPDFLNGIVVTAPAVKISDDISPLLVKISGVLSALAPRLKTITLDSASISHDPEVMKRYDSDPLNYRGGLPARTGAELNGAVKRIQTNMEAITLPILIGHGTQDKLADINGSRFLYQRVSSSDKTLKTYEGYYHEIMNEIGKEVVLNDIATWMDAHKG